MFALFIKIKIKLRNYSRTRALKKFIGVNYQLRKFKIIIRERKLVNHNSIHDFII